MRSKNRGLGDITAKIASFSGAKALIESVLGEDCGCDERQELMNELVPMNKDVDEVADDTKRFDKAMSIAFVNDLVSRKRSNSRISKEEFTLFWDMYREYVNPRKMNTTCGKCINRSIDELQRILTK